MKVFLDTNIFIEYTTCRKQFRWVRDVFDAIEDEIISAVASVGGMYTNNIINKKPLGIALPGGFFGSYGWWRLTG